MNLMKWFLIDVYDVFFRTWIDLKVSWACWWYGHVWIHKGITHCGRCGTIDFTEEEAQKWLENHSLRYKP